MVATMTAGLAGMDARERARIVSAEQRREWFTIENKTDRGNPTATIRIFDEVGFFGVSAQGFVDELDALDVKAIDLHINSPGGEVWDGIAIRNALAAHPARVTTYVDGVAASIASIIAISGDEVVMSRNSELMVHDAWGLVMGNAADMADMVTRLDKQSDNIASMYAEKAGGTLEDWRNAMRAETWYSADEAVEAGLADRVIEKPGTAETKNRFNLAIYNYAGRSHAPAPTSLSAAAAGTTEQEAHMTGAGDAATVDTPAAPTAAGEAAVSVHTPPDPSPLGDPADTPVAPAPGSSHNQEGAGMTTIDPVRLREALGLHPEASDEEVRNAVIASGFASLVPFGEGTVQPARVGGQNRAQTPGPGVVMVDQSILDQLRQDAAAGQEAFARLVRQERDRTIAAAINDGKFAPARREHWEKAWDRDPEGTKDAIGGLTKGLIPTSPQGYSMDPEAKTADDELYAELYGKAGA